MNEFDSDSDLFENVDEYKGENLLSKQEDVSKRSGENIQTLQLNTNKAGMGGLDTVKINDIIQKASQGSKFYTHKQKCQERIDVRVSKMKKTIAKLTDEQIKRAENEMTKLGTEMEMSRDMSQTIVHIDMDMFYAAVEMRDNPSLREKPMAVGSNAMLSTSNYAARKFGVRAAMPGFIGKKLCPDLVIVPCNFSKYREVSHHIQSVFEEYDPQFCPMSLDEAYLNITAFLEANKDKYSPNGDETAVEIVVAEIRKKIEEKTQLTASAGIACNTRLAKVCSDMNKPNGQFYLPPHKESVMKFVKDLPIRKVSGIGNVTEQQLKGLGITSCSDLWERRGILRILFSPSSSSFFMRVSLGLGSTDVTPSSEREQKSISTETTFSGTSDRKTLSNLCQDLCKELKQDMAKKNLYGKVFTLKVKTTDFQIRTRAQTLLEHTQDEGVMASVGMKLLVNELESEPSKGPLELRLLGVRMSNLVDKSQLSSERQTTLVDMFKKGDITAAGVQEDRSQKLVDMFKKGDLTAVVQEDRQTKLVDMFKKSSRTASTQEKRIPGDSETQDCYIIEDDPEANSEFLNIASRSAPNSSNDLESTSSFYKELNDASKLSSSFSKDLDINSNSTKQDKFSRISSSSSKDLDITSNSSKTLDITYKSTLNSSSLSNPSKPLDTIQTVDSSTECRWLDSSSTSEHRSQISDETDNKTSTLGIKCSVPPDTNCSKETYLCPVCSKATFCDISELNRHIDLCLNMQYVQELVKGTDTAGHSSKDSGHSSKDFGHSSKDFGRRSKDSGHSSKEPGHGSKDPRGRISDYDTHQGKRKSGKVPTPISKKQKKDSATQSTLLNYLEFK